MELKDSKTAQNLKDAFAVEASDGRRYDYFAEQAKIEGATEVEAVFRSIVDERRGPNGNIAGHMDYLPLLGEKTADNLKSAIESHKKKCTDMYAGMAKTAKEEGFEEIAGWFEKLSKDESSHAGKFQKTLDTYLAQ